MARSNAWKNLEKEIALELRGERVSRGADFSVKSVDVKVHDFPFLKIDGKYRQRWSHHKFLDDIVEKYCEEPGDIPILVTKHPRLRGAYVSLPLESFAIFLDALREWRDGKRPKPIKRRKRKRKK